MELKQISRQVVIAGTILIWMIKWMIRPFHPFEGPGSFFLGVAPNLFGSFLIPFAACWLFSGKDYWLARWFRLRSVYDLRVVCFSGLCMLLVNEYLQRIPLFGRTFDYNDILFSVIGLVTSYFVFGRLLQRWQLQTG